MSAKINRYSHVFATWEVYPRVHFFQRRFVDLHKRFKTLTGAFPATYNDMNVLSEIEKLNNALGKSFSVTVFGKEDLPTKEFAVSGQEIDDKPQNGISLFVCYAQVNDIDKNSLQAVEDMLNQVICMAESKQSLDLVVFYCDIRHGFSKSDFMEALVQVSVRVNKAHSGKGVAPENIIIGRNAYTLQNKMSELLETRIVDGFVKISSYLQRFVRFDRRYDQETLDILKTEACVKAVQEFLRNGHNLYDMRRKAATDEAFLEQVTDTLSNIIRFAVVPEMATKHNVQLWMCDKLLQEIQFEKTLRENISKNTRYHLTKLKIYYPEVEVSMEDPTSDTQTKPHNFDFLVYPLQSDLADVVRFAEKKLSAMQYLTNVMRKMMHEIKGYMRQTVVQLQTTDEQEFTAPNIANHLRECVYGLGTFYGQLEIHVEKDNAEHLSALKSKIIATMNECKFQHPFVIKEVCLKPKQMAKNFYEQGDTLKCCFPDVNDNVPEGTLGCLVKGIDNKHYGLTCAHVVDPRPRPKMNVMVQKRGQSQKQFGISLHNLCLRPWEGNLRNIDIAAVKVYPNVIQDCNLSLKDDIGQIKPAQIVNKSGKQLAGSFVFKSGAKTEITKGIIASTDYNVAVANLPDHLIVIEVMPAEDEKDIAEKARELVNGDNGSPSRPDSSSDMSAARLDENDCKQPDESNHYDCEEGEHIDLRLHIGNGETKELPSVAPGIENLQLESAARGISCKSPFYEADQLRDENALEISQHSPSAFAEPGDSGSIVCMLDLESKSIEPVSMVSAGDLQLKAHDLDCFENKMCISFHLKKGLQELGYRYKRNRNFFKFE